jgi:hypothetical protein
MEVELIKNLTQLKMAYKQTFSYNFKLPKFKVFGSPDSAEKIVRILDLANILQFTWICMRRPN